MFKKLTQKEEAEFKEWAKLNYKPFEPIKGIWHPIIQAECVKMNEAADLTATQLQRKKMKILRESPKFPQPQKGQRVKYYNDPFTRTQPLGEATITKFVSENGVCNNIPYWLCEVETGEEVRMVIFANMDICNEI